MSIRYHLNTAGFRIAYFSKEYANRIAVTCYDSYRKRSYTYMDLFKLSVQTAGFLLQKGCKKGDAVMVSAKNCTEYAVLIFAGAILGIKIVPVDINLPVTCIMRYLSIVRPKVFFTSRNDILEDDDMMNTLAVPITQFFERIALFPDVVEAMYEMFPEVEWYVDENDVFFVIFTSGTTSEPKSVPLTHRNLISNIANLRQMCAVPESYAVLSMAPLSHAMGLTLGLFAILAYGAHLVLAENLDSTTLRRILQQERIDGLVTVPAFLNLIKEKIEEGVRAQGKEHSLEKALRKADRMPMRLRRIVFNKVRRKIGKDLKWIVTGGAPLRQEVGNFFEALGVQVTQGYGLTECLMVCVSDFEWRKMGTVGKCLPNQQIRLDENNEIWVAGPNVFGGYTDQDEINQEIFKDGWMRTGDIGHLDEDGHLTILGRAKNVIIGPSGLNIYPEDIEAAVLRCEHIRECVVLNAPKREDDVYLIAVVLLAETASDNNLDVLRDNINQRLGSRQRLAKVVLWHESDLPRTPSRKIIRQAVENAIIGNCTLETSKPVAEMLHIADQRSDQVLLNVIASLCGRNVEEINLSDRLLGDLGFDSLGLMELIIQMEADFSMQLPRDVLFQRDLSVQDVIDLLDSRTIEPTVPAELYTPSIVVRGLLVISRWISRQIFPAMFRIFFQMEISGRFHREKLSADMAREGHILIANHASHLDAPSIYAALPKQARRRMVAAAAKDYFFNSNAKLRHVLLAANLRVFPLERTTDPRDYFTVIAEMLDRGDSVLIFPEGTRSRTGALGTFHPSVGKLIQELSAPVIPIQIEGTHALWPPNETVPKRGKLKVRFHAPRSFSKRLSPYEICDRLAALFDKNQELIQEEVDYGYASKPVFRNRTEGRHC